MTDFIPGTKYRRRGGGYYLYHGLTEDGKLLVETRGGIYKLLPGPGFALLPYTDTDGDMLPVVFSQSIKYSKVVYLAKPPCPATDSFDLGRYLFGSGNWLWSDKPYKKYTIPVRITVETIQEGEG